MSTTDENVEAVKKMILYNRRITIREVAGDVDMSLFTNVSVTKHAVATILPKLLHFEQKKCLIDMAQSWRKAYW